LLIRSFAENVGSQSSLTCCVRERGT